MQTPPGLLENISDRQHNRGPDDRGLVQIEGLASLAHTRLSIVDLSEAGHQPMSDGSGRFSIVFNGEIYNHQALRRRALDNGWVFRGASDTEVLLACWAIFGEGILTSLNGMFAFCIVDRFERRATLVRDRFGVKPLYYRAIGEGLAFASMPDVLATAVQPLCFDRTYLARGLSSWAWDTDQPDSAFTGVASLPGGCMMSVDLGNPGQPAMRVTKWYDFKAMARSLDPEFDRDRAGEALRSTLEDSISLRMKADVPVGLSLSGGLDSSIIAAVASKEATEPIRAYSFSLGPNDKETVAVDALARALGPRRLKVRKVGPPGPQDMGSFVEAAIMCQGSPAAGLDALAQFQVFKAARDDGIAVMLGGQGADEALMGYRKYQLALARESLATGRPLRAGIQSAQLLRTLMHEGRDLGAYFQAASRYRQGNSKKGLTFWLPPADPLHIPTSPQDLQALDVLEFGLPTMLRHEDRNSMAHSVESRHPFMDYRIMELGLRLDTRLKVHAGYGKWLLRDVFADEVPQSIVWARFKRGFKPGTQRWLRNGVGSHLRSIIAAHQTVISDALSVPTSAVAPSAYTDAALEKSGTAMRDALVLSWVGLTLMRERGDRYG